MGQKLSAKNKIIFFMFLCCLVYFMSYLTRLNYTAALAEICGALSIDRQSASLPITGCFVVYGAGQLLCGILGDKVSPRNMIFTGLFLSSACNLCVSAVSSVHLLTALWCVNGFAQAMIWPPLIRIMADTLDEKAYQKCCIAVYGASCAGTIAVYLLVPVCVAVLQWRTVFIISAVSGLIVCAVWFICITRLCGGTASSYPASDKSSARSSISAEIPARKQTNGNLVKNPRSSRSSSEYLFLAMQAPLLLMLAAGIFHGILRDGITTWLPVYISESFGLNHSVSILTTAILPAFAIISVMLASKVLLRLKNEMLAAAFMFSCAFIFCLILLPFQSSSAIVSVAMMTLMTGCMHGVNLFIISHAPKRFEKYGKISAISGILNAATYIGSALSTYVFAGISEKFGWHTTILCWAAFLFAGFIASAAAVRKWRGFIGGGQTAVLKKRAA